jgi:GPH family glycoside/pentoside/hexuronide:cation symporter
MDAPISDKPPGHQLRHDTSLVDRVSLREKIGLGFGKVVGDGTHGTLHVLVSPIYNMTLGLNPALISTIVFIQRLWDAMLDPAFGQFSDNFRSRWGRRRPLLFIAAFPVALLFGALWWFPRGVSAHYLFWYLLLVSLAFYAAYSLYTMPLGGLIIEATDDYHERTRIAGVALAFGFAAQVGSQWIFPVTQLSIFPDTITGVRWVAVGCVLFFFVAGLVPAVLCRERLYANVAAKQRRIPFLESWRAVRQNKSFMALLWVRGIFSFGTNVVGMLSGYMYIYYVFGGNIKAAAFGVATIGSCYHIAAILTSLAVYPHIERRIGKRHTLQVAAGVLIVGCFSKIFLYQPGHAWLPLMVIAINGISNAGVSLMCIAMLGDIADYDEWQTGLRREGLFSSLLSWFEKAGNSLGSFLTGFVLVWIGFNAKLGPQSDHTLWLMKLAYVVGPATGSLLTLFFVHRYELSQDQVYEIKEELARRRAAKNLLSADDVSTR